MRTRASKQLPIEDEKPLSIWQLYIQRTGDAKKPTKQVQHGGTSRKELIGLNKGHFHMSEETKKTMRIHVFSYIGYSWIHLFMI